MNGPDDFVSWQDELDQWSKGYKHSGKTKSMSYHDPEWSKLVFEQAQEKYLWETPTVHTHFEETKMNDVVETIYEHAGMMDKMPPHQLSAIKIALTDMQVKASIASKAMEAYWEAYVYSESMVQVHDYPCGHGHKCIMSPDFHVNKLVEVCPGLESTQLVECPEPTCVKVYGYTVKEHGLVQPPATRYPLTRCIIHLNDYHEWSREVIADWLDTTGVDLTIETKDDYDNEDLF